MLVVKVCHHTVICLWCCCCLEKKGLPIPRSRYCASLGRRRRHLLLFILICHLLVSQRGCLLVACVQIMCHLFTIMYKCTYISTYLTLRVVSQLEDCRDSTTAQILGPTFFANV